MKVETYGDVYTCAAAEQHADGVHLLDGDGKIIVIVADMSNVLDVEGGEIVVVEPQPPTAKERIAKLEEENAQLKEALELLLSGEVSEDG